MGFFNWFFKNTIGDSDKVIGYNWDIFDFLIYYIEIVKLEIKYSDRFEYFLFYYHGCKIEICGGVILTDSSHIKFSKEQIQMLYSKASKLYYDEFQKIEKEQEKIDVEKLRSRI